mgnify:CR=1 FL=1
MTYVFELDFNDDHSSGAGQPLEVDGFSADGVSGIGLKGGHC